MPIASSTIAIRAGWLIAVAYVLCWIVGLSIGGPTLDPGATSTQVDEVFADSSSILAFSVLVHGVAAGLLVALGLSLGSGRQRTAAIAASCAAAVLSLAQFVGEVSVVVASESVDSALMWEVLTRIDGLKMLVLTVLIGTVYAGRVQRTVTFSGVSAVAGLALTLTGVGYLALHLPLMNIATLSLPLLLVWALVATGSRVLPSRRELARL